MREKLVQGVGLLEAEMGLAIQKQLNYQSSDQALQALTYRFIFGDPQTDSLDDDPFFTSSQRALDQRSQASSTRSSLANACQNGRDLIRIDGALRAALRESVQDICEKASGQAPSPDIGELENDKAEISRHLPELSGQALLKGAQALLSLVDCIGKLETGSLEESGIGWTLAGSALSQKIVTYDLQLFLQYFDGQLRVQNKAEFEERISEFKRAFHAELSK